MIGLDNTKSKFKTFVFEKQETQQSIFIQKQIDPSLTTVDLSDTLEEHASISEHSIFIYDPRNNQFVSLQKIGTGNGKVPQYYLEPTFVLIKYKRRKGIYEDDSNLQMNSEDESSKVVDNRSKERTIAEVIALVKHWRELNMNAPKPKNPKKKMNLQDAAKEVGVSKKSLDDYYCQLRLAELHNFNFPDNMNEKMGKLRTYVKQHRIDEAARIRHHKHPRTLKIIEEFTMDPKMAEYIQREKELSEEEYSQMKEESNHMVEQNPILSQKFEHNLFSIENNFYQNFEFLMDDPSDPFMFQNADFKKKYFESESEEFNFF